MQMWTLLLKLPKYYIAIVVLHNFLVKDKSKQNRYCPPHILDQERDREIYPGEWRQEVSCNAHRYE